MSKQSRVSGTHMHPKLKTGLKMKSPLSVDELRYLRDAIKELKTTDKIDMSSEELDKVFQEAISSINVEHFDWWRVDDRA